MKRYKIFGLAVAGMLALNSCNSALDVNEKGVIPTAQYYQTDDESEKGITNVYSNLHALMSDYFMVKNCLSDDVYSGGRGMYENELNEYLFTADNEGITALFTDYYNLIYSANLIINHVNPDTPTKQRNVAEAKYFRGWAYFELVTLWGTAPLVLEDERSDYRVSNSTVEELWNQVNSDLADAVNSGALPSKTSVNDTDTPIRITKEAAQAMYGKALVFQGKYAEANQYLDAVINSGLYAMLQLDSDGYLDYNSYRYDNNSEVLLQINRLNDASNNNTEIQCMWFGLPASNFIRDAQSTLPYYTESWGFCTSAKEALVKAFQDNAAKNGVNDIRYTTSLLSVDDICLRYNVKLMEGSYFEDCCGYFVNKLMALTENHISMTWAGWQQNTVLMRYAEVLLLAAESHLQSGDAAKALRYINVIREHAGEPLATSVTLDDIKTEKRLELCDEAVRYQDITRWGDAYSLLKDQGKEIGYYGYNNGVLGLWYPIQQAEAGYQQGRNELLPFPQNELNVNPNITQNPGF